MRPQKLMLAVLLLAAGPAAAACSGGIAYSGRLWDAMAQIESTEAPRQLLQRMDGAQVEVMALFARLHRRRPGESRVLEAARDAPARVIIGAPKAFDESGDLSLRFAERTLREVDARQYRFVGELMFTHGDKTHGEQTADGERYVDPLSPGVIALLDGLKRRRIPIMTHWEVYEWDRDWPRVSSLYARYPDQLFIWPHMGFAHAAQVHRVLERHPNVVVTLSKREQDQRALSDSEKSAQLGPPLVDPCEVITNEWLTLLQAYPDRMLFATDAHKDFRWRKYEAVVATWRRILGQLPPQLAAKIAWENAARVYGNPR